jgi:hypothetical protein
MGTITVQVVLTETVTPMNGAALDAVIAWLAANITSKLPTGVTATIVFTNLTQ